MFCAKQLPIVAIRSDLPNLKRGAWPSLGSSKSRDADRACFPSLKGFDVAVGAGGVRGHGTDLMVARHFSVASHRLVDCSRPRHMC